MGNMAARRCARAVAFAGRLKLALERSEDWSQDKLAKKLGVHVNTVQRWVSGEAEPKLGILVEISKLLKVSTDFLLGIV